jgi:hypothetical protein
MELSKHAEMTGRGFNRVPQDMGSTKPGPPDDSEPKSDEIFSFGTKLRA